jgi:ankyrin repeat protein
LAISSGQPDLVSKLLAAQAYVNASTGISPNSHLLLAISKGHVQMAEQLLEAGADVDEEDSEYCTALHLAAGAGYTQLITLLVERGADVDAQDRQEATPLHAALAEGHTQAASQLIALGADCNLPDADSVYALHLAAGSGNAQLVEALLAVGADPVKLDSSGNTPLHLAAAAGHAAVVDLLLAAPGMDPDAARPGTQYTALHAAARAGQAEVCQRLVAGGASLELEATESGLTPLGEAVQHADLKTVRALLAAGANPNVDASLGTLLQTAVFDRAADDIVEALVKGGADINATDEAGDTALHLAVQHERYGAVQLLLRLGASTSIASRTSGTPLHLAAKSEEPFLVQQLAAASANLDTLSSSSGFATPCTPLYVAVEVGDAETVEVLLAAGADASKGNSKGHTPLHAALQRGHTQLVARLVAAGANLNAVSEEAGTALAMAVQAGEQAMVDLLLAAGADPTLGSAKVVAPLTAAVRACNFELLCKMLEAPALQAAKPVADGPEPSHASGAAAVPAESAAPATGTTAAAVTQSAMPSSSSLTNGPAQEDNSSSTSSSSGRNRIRDRMGAALLEAMATKDMFLVALLLKGGASPNIMDPLQGAPLHLALKASDAALVARLLEAGADVNLVSPSLGTPLAIAVNQQDSRLVGMLLHAGALPDQHCIDGNTLLNVAAGSGQVAIAEQLLGAGAAVNLVCNQGLAPLHTAIAYGDKQMVQQLLLRGAALHINSSAYGTPLQAAVNTALQSPAPPGALGVIRLLLAAGADPNAGGYGSTAGASLLHAAVEGCDVELVQLLVDAGALVEPSNSQRTPLQVAVCSNAAEVVQVLLAAGANPNVCSAVTDDDADIKQVSLLEEALNNKYHTIAAALLAHGADANGSHSSGCRTLLGAAVGSRDMAAVELLLAAGANPNTGGPVAGSMPLMLAVQQGSSDIAERLLAAGAHPNIVCNLERCTPLQAAISKARIGLALKLLAAGADPNLGHEFFMGTALQLALTGQHGLVEALLAAGAHPDAVNLYQRDAPLQLAVCRGYWQDAAALLARGADASVVSSRNGDTLLHTAVRGRSSRMLELLVASAADINATNHDGATPLVTAATHMRYCDKDMMQQLLKWPNIDCNIKDGSGCVALHYAVLSSSGGTSSNSSDSTMGQLLNRGADPAIRDRKGRTPLHLAAVNGRLGAVQQLVAAGADVSATAGSMGWTPLMLAVAAGYEDVVRCLLAGGAAASVSAGMADGTTALHLACGRPGTEQMVADLLAAGAHAAAADSSDNTPLHSAAAAGAADTVSRLLDAGAEVWSANSDLELPLHLAIAGGHTAAAVQLIAAAKASDEQSINAVTAAGAAPIHLAAVKDSSMLRVLLQCSALQVDVVDGAGQTALHLAAAGGYLKNIRQLVQHGASLGVADVQGAHPLHLAAAGGFIESVKCLVTAGADRAALDADGATPLHRLPLQTCSPQLVALLATPSNINRVVGGTTLLHTAAASSNEEVVAALLAAGATTGTHNSKGECALVTAARQGNVGVLCLLLRHMLWQHKQQAPAGLAALPPAVVTAVQATLVGREESISMSMFKVVLQVLGEGAASVLWQQLVEQHNSSMAQQGGLPKQQHQRQPTRAHKQEQLQGRLGERVLAVAVQGFLEAGATVARQQEKLTQPLDQAVVSQLIKSTAPHGQLGRRQPAPEAVSAAATFEAAAAQQKVATLEHTTEAACLGQRHEVLRLLQQLPEEVLADALSSAAQAAAGAEHYQLCVQLLQQLVVLDDVEAKRVFGHLGCVTEEDTCPAMKVLEPRSLALCGEVLTGWQALRRQQQQELVDSVVSAVVVWKEEQQQVVMRGRKRLCPPGRGHVP